MATKQYTVLLYDEIGPEYYGLLGGKWMSDHLDKANGADIALRINSPGGSVIEGQAIYSALARYPGKVTVYVDSLAASAASFVAMAASRIEIAKNAMFMIHNAWSFAIGDANALRKTADVLDTVNEIVVNQYAARTGKTVDEIKAWMDAETWMNAEESVARGFADAIGQELVSAPAACVRPDAFRNTPDRFKAPAASVSDAVLSLRASRRKLALARARTS